MRRQSILVVAVGGLMAVGSLFAGLARADPTILGIVVRLERLLFPSFPPASPLNEGGLLYDSTNKLVKFSDGATWSPVGTSGEVVQVGDIVPVPFLSVGTQAVRSAQTNYEGATFSVSGASQFSTIHFKVTARATAPTISILVYQAPGGGAGVTNLKASIVNVPIPVTGNYAVPITQGIATLEAGRIYILWGKQASASGSVSLRVYGNDIYDLFNSNVPSGLVPTTFGTAISTATAPATFNPAVVTGQTIELGADIALVTRFSTP